MLMASGNDLVIIFLGLEILSIATYVMAGFRRTDLRSNESSLKYFILGSFSSAFLLYGIALDLRRDGDEGGLGRNDQHHADRRATGQRALPAARFCGRGDAARRLRLQGGDRAFSHLDAGRLRGRAHTRHGLYGGRAEGRRASPRSCAFSSSASRSSPPPPGRRAAGQANSAWVSALVVMAIITMTVGNIVAIVQNNVKRMLAYSSIAHAGYALVGFIAAGAAADAAQRDDARGVRRLLHADLRGDESGRVRHRHLISRNNDRRTEVEDYNGIGFRAPALAFTLSLFLLSLLGLPLTAGFMGKVMVFRAALNQGFYGLVVIAVLNTAISAYYYLRLIIVMFFRERTTEWIAPQRAGERRRGHRHHGPGRLLSGALPSRVIDAFQRKPAPPVARRRAAF